MDLKTYKRTIRTYTEQELETFIKLWGHQPEQEDGGVPMKTQLAERELARREDSRKSGEYVDETLPSHVPPRKR